MEAKPRLGWTVPLVLLLGCSPAIDSAQFVRMAPGPSGQEIRIFSHKLPTCAYDELGRITGARRHGFQSLQEVLDAMRERAREMGGHAILGLGAVQQPSGVDAEDDPATALTGTVIRFSDESCTT